MTPTPYGKKALTGESWKVRSARPGTRNDTLNKAAYSLGTLIPKHLTDRLVVAVLTEAAQVATVGAKGSDPLTEEEIRDTIMSGLQAGMSNPRDVPVGYTSRHNAIRDLDVIEAKWHEVPMGGWQGRRCKQVMPAILKVAKEIGGPKNVPLGLNRLSIEAGTSKSTVSKALADLEQLGWLTKTALSGPGRSARYTIQLPPTASRTKDDTTPYLSGNWERPNNAMEGHDAFRPGALGTTGGRVWKWLSASVGEWHRQADIARGLGVHAGTVGRHVSTDGMLVRLGFVERDSIARVRAVVPITLKHLDKIAHLAQTLGRRDEHRERLVAYYQAEGSLDTDLYWLDPRDGTRRAQAFWLRPENATKRLAQSNETGIAIPRARGQVESP